MSKDKGPARPDKPEAALLAGICLLELYTGQSHVDHYTQVSEREPEAERDEKGVD